MQTSTILWRRCLPPLQRPLSCPNYHRSSSTTSTMFPTGACSLVCTQWYPRIQKRLFVRVKLKSEGDLQRWRTRNRPGPEGPSPPAEDPHTPEHGTHARSNLPKPWLPLLHRAGSHLRSFSGLRALENWRWMMYTHDVSSTLRSLGSSCET